MPMSQADRQFLDALLAAPSPSGYEQPVQEVVRRYAAEFADSVSTDRHGNVIAAVNPGGELRIMLAGHCDQIGLIVKNIDDRGFLWVQTIGGWDPMVLLGQRVQVWSKTGPLPGIIARKPIHLQSPEDRKVIPEIKHLWVDIGALNGDEARAAVRVGDVITCELHQQELRNGFLSGVAMDDKVGVWTVFTAARRAAAQSPKAAIFAVSTVQEEIGLRGVQTSAAAIKPHVGLVTDVTHATDCPTIDENQHGRIKLGQGPVVYRGPNTSPRVLEVIEHEAALLGIPYQLASLGSPASNDAAQLQLAGDGVAMGLICIPNRYMHSPVEMVSLEDLEHAANLMAAFCAHVSEETNFIP
ncbi:MAG: hydrolase [Planctomyces sp.]|jgi:endoglucanase|nr:hydrolase [Planctomyces sp.]